MSGTASAVIFDGTDLNRGTTLVSSLGFISTDKVVSYRTNGNDVVVMRIDI